MRTLGTITAASAVGVGTVRTASEPGAASDHYKWEAQEQDDVTETAGDDSFHNLELSCGTKLGFEGYASSANEYNFELVQAAGTEWTDEDGGEEIDGVRKHAVTIESCASEFYPYLEENMTGTTPPDSGDRVTEDLRGLAGPAISIAAAPLDYAGDALTALETTAEVVGILSDDNPNCSRHKSKWSVDRVWSSDTGRVVGSTTQTEFGVEPPSDTHDGDVTISSYVFADDAAKPSQYGRTCEVTNKFNVNLENGNAQLNWAWSTTDSSYA